jgi:hypothetical protein
MMTPAEAHKETGPVKKRWRTNREVPEICEKSRKSQQHLITEYVEPF